MSTLQLIVAIASIFNSVLFLILFIEDGNTKHFIMMYGCLICGGLMLDFYIKGLVQ